MIVEDLVGAGLVAGGVSVGIGVSVDVDIEVGVMVIVRDRVKLTVGSTEIVGVEDGVSETDRVSVDVTVVDAIEDPVPVFVDETDGRRERVSVREPVKVGDKEDVRVGVGV